MGGTVHYQGPKLQQCQWSQWEPARLFSEPDMQKMHLDAVGEKQNKEKKSQIINEKVEQETTAEEMRKGGKKKEERKVWLWNNIHLHWEWQVCRAWYFVPYLLPLTQGLRSRPACMREKKERKNSLKNYAFNSVIWASFEWVTFGWKGHWNV